MARPLAVTAFSSQPARYERRRRPSFRMHWPLFTAVFFAFVVLAMTATLLIPKQYTATAKMIVGGTQTSATVIDLIQDGPVVDKVIAALKLDQTRAQLLGRINVKPVPNTSIVSLSATAGSPAQAATIANTFPAIFIDRERELISSQAVAEQTYLQNAVSDAENTLQQANAALSGYQAKYRTESKVEQLQSDQSQAQAELASVQSQIAALPPTIAGQQVTDVNPTSTQLQQQLAETELQLATARQRYTDKHPAVIALEQQERALQSQIAAEPVTVAGQVVAVPNPLYQQLSQQAATLRSQIQVDGVQIAALQQGRKALGAAAVVPATQLGFLQERARLASGVYKALEQEYDDAVVSANSATSDVTVVQPADPGNVSVSPNLIVNFVASIVIGLILALLAVAIAAVIRPRIREDRDVERTLSLPVIAHIPSMAAPHQRALPWLQTVTLEAFLHLCASLRILGRKYGNHVIVITSPEKGDGKTTIAYHLALAISRIRSRVLLIDADMRCPATHTQANIENVRGLSDVLSGQRSFEQTVVHHTAALDILTAGTLPPNPVALAESSSLDDLLDFARERYDCIIIDTPALTPVVDSALIAVRADATALVLSANNSHEGAAGEAVTRLRSLGVDNILGVILNRATTRFSDYGDYFASQAPALQASR